MNRLKRIIAKYPFHPLLFAFYPALFLWVDNIDQIPLFAILQPLVLSVGFAIIVYGIFCFIFQSINKSGIVASFFILLTLSYGHVYNYIESHPAINTYIGYFRLLAIFLIFQAVCFLIIWRYKGDLRPLNQTLLLICLLLMVMTIGQAVIFYMKGIPANAFTEKKRITNKQTNTNNEFSDRDIYYIILDSYGREDLLKSHYSYDNSSFINELQDLGFVVPECTQSNYDNTVFSMTSALNLNYLTELPVNLDETSDNIDIQGLSPYIRHSLVREKFESYGYQTVSFKTVYPFLDIKDTDFYYDLEQSADFYNKLESENFQYLFFHTTVLRILIEILEAPPDYLFAEDATLVQVYIAKILIPQKKLFSTRHFKWYEQHRFAFERLEEVAEIPGNKFIYAHLFTTHQPFVFTTSGQVRWPVIENNEAYLDQITYTNIRMIKIIKMILDKSINPPVIVIQGDHSYVTGENRNKILNAYFLPEGGSEQITPAFSPINTFRLIFNTYFGERYELLPDVAYRSLEGRPYQFEILPVSCVESTE
jgi:hypothetical protein